MKIIIAVIFRYSFGQRMDLGRRFQLFTESCTIKRNKTNSGQKQFHS